MILLTEINSLLQQEKPHLETENLRQSSYGCKAKPDEEVHCGVTPSLSHNMKKVLLSVLLFVCYPSHSSYMCANNTLRGQGFVHCLLMKLCVY